MVEVLAIVPARSGTTILPTIIDGESDADIDSLVDFEKAENSFKNSIACNRVPAIKRR